MRRAISTLLAAALLLGLLSACRETSPDILPSQEYTARELVDAALLYSGYDGDSGNLEDLTAEEGGELLTAYIENAYDIHSTELPWEDAAVLRATGASAFEIAVLRLKDEDGAVRAAAKLMSYMSARQGDFAGYAPAEVDMIANSGIRQIGPWLGLFICPDPARAERAFEAALHGDTLPTQPTDVPKVEAEVGAMLDYLMEQCGDVPDGLLQWLDDSDPELLEGYISSSYGLTREQWEKAAIVHGSRDSAFEIAVLRVKDRDAARDVTDILTEYLDDREALFAGYAPDQAELLYQATVHNIRGDLIGAYVIMLVCEDAEQVFDTLAWSLQPSSTGTVGRHQNESREPGYDPDYPDRVEFTQPNKDDMSIYDTSAILSAWEKGNPSGLSSYDRRIYDQAQKVLKEVIKDGMSDYEKEKAVYNWVVQNVNYDWTHQNILKKTPRESYTPYGGLVNHTAVCLGYATTFQLLMDMAGVECITVPGAAFSSTEDHGWNMVRLNGEWYCVDVTWDANMREQSAQAGFGWPEEYWNYFNVTSDEMADEDHQWDYVNTPEATAGDRGLG